LAAEKNESDDGGDKFTVACRHRSSFRVATVLMKPVPHAAELAAISLLPEFSPELTDVVASLMKALVQIPDVGINRVGVRTRCAFRKDAGTCPSLHGAQTEVESSSDIGACFNTRWCGSRAVLKASLMLRIRCQRSAIWTACGAALRVASA
jgi:hypothetical protein